MIVAVTAYRCDDERKQVSSVRVLYITLLLSRIYHRHFLFSSWTILCGLLSRYAFRRV